MSGKSRRHLRCQLREKKGSPEYSEPPAFAKPVKSKWVATIITDDDVTVHMTVPDKNAREVRTLIAKNFGPEALDRLHVEEKPYTWKCDGSDGCMNA